MDRQALKKGQHENLEQCLFKWFISAREAHHSITHEMIKGIQVEKVQEEKESEKLSQKRKRR